MKGEAPGVFSIPGLIFGKMNCFISDKRSRGTYILYRNNSGLEINDGLLKRRNRWVTEGEKKPVRIAGYDFYPFQIRHLPDWKACASRLDLEKESVQNNEVNLLGKEFIMHQAGYREIKQWLAQNRKLMIDCPKQPGNLLISKNACSKRHKSSLHPDQKIYSEDFFGYALLQGLSRCRDCHIGKRLIRA